MESNNNVKKLLVINPGSTSTKLAIFEKQGTNVEKVFATTASHSIEELSKFDTIAEQEDYRFETCIRCLDENNFSLKSLYAVIAIGGLLKSVTSGVYEISEEMLNDLRMAKYGEHAANLGAILAKRISKETGCPAYIADPITVDEMQDIARVSGHPLIPRYGRTHTLNHKRTAMDVSRELGKRYEDARLIIAHLGGGVSIGAHCCGKIIDSTSSRGEGAFSMNRSGQLNSWELAKLCFSGKYDKKEVLAMLNGKGGVLAYGGTADFRDLEAAADSGDETSLAVFNALAYQVSKEIASMAAVLSGKFDAIVLTGGIAYSEKFVKLVTDRISFLGKIILKPGEQEMESLAAYLNDVLENRIEVKQYR